MTIRFPGAGSWQVWIWRRSHLRTGEGNPCHPFGGKSRLKVLAALLTVEMIELRHSLDCFIGIAYDEACHTMLHYWAPNRDAMQSRVFP